MSKRLNIELQAKLEPQRVDYALRRLRAAGVHPNQEDKASISFFSKEVKSHSILTQVGLLAKPSWMDADLTIF